MVFGCCSECSSAVARFAANTVAKSSDVPISRAILPGDIDAKDDMRAPSRKRDAILGHVASWADRRIPIELLQRSRRVLSTRSPRRRDLRKSPARDDNRQSGFQKQNEDDLPECDLIQFAV